MVKGRIVHCKDFAKTCSGVLPLIFGCGPLLSCEHFVRTLKRLALRYHHYWHIVWYAFGFSFVCFCLFVTFRSDSLRIFGCVPFPPYCKTLTNSHEYAHIVHPRYSRPLYQGTLFTRGLFVFQVNLFLEMAKLWDMGAYHFISQKAVFAVLRAHPTSGKVHLVCKVTLQREA